MEFICIKRFKTEFDLIFEKGNIYDIAFGVEITHNTGKKRRCYWWKNYYFKEEEFIEHFISIADWRQQQINSILDE